MVKKPDSNQARLKRHARVRAKISGTPERPRLNLFRSAKHIYAQLIDDTQGVTLVSASRKQLVRSVKPSPQELSRKVFPRSFLTAAVIFIMAVYRNWQREPARAASNSN